MALRLRPWLASIDAGTAYSVPSIANIDRHGARFRGRDLLRTVAEGTAGAIGDEFLRCLVRHVALAFGAKFAFVAEASDPDGDARPCAQRLVRRRLAGRAARVRHQRQAVRARRGAGGRRVPGGADEALPGGQAGDRHGARELPRGLSARRRRQPPRPPGRDGRGADGGRGRRRRRDAHLRVARRGRARAPPPGGGAAGARARGSSRPPTPSAGGSAATCTTAPSSGCWPSGTCSRSPSASSTTSTRRPASCALAHDELGEAHAELRDLARGLHPVALSERGLRGALESLTVACECGSRSTSRATSCRSTSSSPRTSSSASR